MEIVYILDRNNSYFWIVLVIKNSVKNIPLCLKPEYPEFSQIFFEYGDSDTEKLLQQICFRLCLSVLLGMVSFNLLMLILSKINFLTYCWIFCRKLYYHL